MTEKTTKAFFTLNLPRRPKEGDSISIKSKLRRDPIEFRVILGVRTAEDRNTSLEPFMTALEFKTLFTEGAIRVTTNWKTDTGWQGEEVIDSDWVDAKGIVNLTLAFESNAVLITDKSNSLITRFRLQFELERIGRLQLWGNIKEMREVSLKYNKANSRRSPRKNNT